MTLLDERPEVQVPEDRPSARRHFSPFNAFAKALAVGVLLLILYPTITALVDIMFTGGRFNSGAFSAAFGSRGLGTVLKNTAIVLVCSCSIAVVFGTLFAWLTERTDANMGFATRILPVMPLMLPPIALSIGWIFLASPNAGFLNVAIRWVFGLVGIDMESGPLNIGSWPGLIFVYSVYLVPYVYLVVAAAFRNSDSSLEEASRISGAGTLSTFWRVSFPAVRPAVLASSLLVAIMCLALYSIPSILGSAAGIPVLSTHLVRLVRGSFPPRLDEAVVLGLLVVVLLTILWMLQRLLTKQGRHGTIGGKGGRASIIELGPWRTPARALILLYLLATSVLPFAALVLVSMQEFWSPSVQWASLSFDNFTSLLTSGGRDRDALFNSWGLAIAGATLAILVAAVLMSFVGQTGGFAGRAVDGVTKLPATISHIVIGLAFVVALGGAPFYLGGTLIILLLAYIVMYMPQASISAGAAYEQIGNELSEASRVSGAGPGKTFQRINLPLMVPGLSAGWAQLFVLMAGDLTASALLAGTANPVIGFVILETWETGVYPELAALGTVMSVVSLLVVATVMVVARPKFHRARST